MVPLALGTDGGGSIRIPCAFSGLPGLKPTFGRVPAWPASPFGPVSHVGPMARTVTDAALLLDVMASRTRATGSRCRRRRRASRPASTTASRACGSRSARTLGYAAVDPEVAALVDRAALAFAELGAHVELVDPGFADPREAFDVLWSSGAARAVALTGEVDDPGLREIAAAGARYAATDYIAALQARDALALRMSLFHEEWDLLLTPTLPLVAFEAGREVPDGADDPRWPGWTPFTFPFNMTQQPAATVPCGFTAAGLPAGLQIVGPRYADALVLRAARAYESARPEPTLAEESSHTPDVPRGDATSPALRDAARRLPPPRPGGLRHDVCRVWGRRPRSPSPPIRAAPRNDIDLDFCDQAIVRRPGAHPRSRRSSDRRPAQRVVHRRPGHRGPGRHRHLLGDGPGAHRAAAGRG